MNDLQLQNSTIATAVSEAFPFSVDKFPLSGPDAMKSPHYGLFRSDNSECTGRAVKKGYVPHQTGDVIALVQAAQTVFDSGECSVKCHWRDGHYVSVAPSNDVRKEMYGGKDAVFPRIIIRAGYDGQAFKATLGLFRDACRNLEMLRNVGGTTTTIRHNSNLPDKMEELVAQFSTLEGGWDSVQKYIDRMTEERVLLSSFLEHLYPTPAENASGNTQTRHRNTIELIVRRVIKEQRELGIPTDGQTMKDFKVDAWMAWNGVQGYVQHDKSRKGENTGDFRRALLAAEDKVVISAGDYLHNLIAV